MTYSMALLFPDFVKKFCDDKSCFVGQGTKSLSRSLFLSAKYWMAVFEKIRTERRVSHRIYFKAAGQSDERTLELIRRSNKKKSHLRIQLLH